jgi:Tetratricopeptide repeat
MSDTNSNQTLMALLASEAEEESIASDDAVGLSDSHGTPQLPTLDQRTDMFLYAVHGPNHSVTPEMRSAARDRLIDAMAADLADQTIGPASVPVETTALQSHGVVAERRPATTSGLSQAWSSFLQHCQTLLPSADAFNVRGLRLAAVPLVALLVVGSVWTTGWINQRDYIEPSGGPSGTSPPTRDRGLPPVDSPAELNLRRDIAAAEAAHGPTNPILAQKLVDLAVLLHADGRYEEAETLCTRALSIQQRALGPKNVETVRTVRQLARIYRAQGRNREADALLARADQP